MCLIVSKRIQIDKIFARAAGPTHLPLDDALNGIIDAPVVAEGLGQAEAVGGCEGEFVGH